MNLDTILRNMLHEMRIVQNVSHIMFAQKISLQLSGTKYQVISTSYQVSGTKSDKVVRSILLYAPGHQNLLTSFS